MKNLELLKILKPFLKPYLKKLFLVLLLLPLSSISFSIQPVIMQRAIDGPLSKGDFSGLWVFALALGLAVLFNFGVQIWQFWLVNIIGQDLIASLRLKIFSHLERLPMSFFDKTPVGRSVSRITSDLEQLSESLAGGLVLVVLDLLNIVTILVFMLYLSPVFALVVSSFLIPIYFLSIYYQEKFRKANLDSRQELAKLNSFLQQNIVGISVVHALNSIKKSMRIFDDNNKKYFQANDQSIKADAQLSALIELVSLLAIVCLIWLSLKIIDSTFHIPISIGIILAFIQYTQSLFEPIRNLTDKFTVIQSAFTALERVNQILEEKEEIFDIKNPLKIPALNTLQNQPLIEFKNVWFRYSPNLPWVLQNINLKIYPGQKVAFVGKTGAGKTSIIKLMTRLYEVTSGEILLGGVNIKDIAQDDLRAFIGTVHQDSYIFAGDLLHNIQLNRNYSQIDWSLVQDMLSKSSLKLETQLSERATNISSGEEQLINFARVFSAHPPVIILDEASAKIDVKTENHLQQVLTKHIKNKTLIYVAHRLETISHCDRIYTLERGKIIDQV
jgi:ATP-binding cassette, subfamily B, multidrug efflux pump